MARLPDVFLEWNYYARRALLQQFIDGVKVDPERFFLEFTRHNPALVTAACINGEIVLNAKIVGCGYVPREEYAMDVVRRLEEHLKLSDEEYSRAYGDGEKLRRLYEEHSLRGAKLLLQLVYHPRGVAEKYIDFEKLATVELAKRLRDRPRQTWNIVQHSRTASLLFFQPPSISFEVKGKITIHTDDIYHRLVTLIHDAYHYTPPEGRGDRPVYILHVEQVYDKSPTKSGFGRRIA
ncbi:hypothetical protein IG193_01330 [Infirmifilum lucidum]|uniref:Uncharacterized protein n=1 Tax=Infirmifilum lucidum TaxID=2776706 RepID=A0A7L9FK12_9CREN|nr:hypothetical protein [Infirmifilum lucidum]QOJ79135.1 hypothetical protein IG193_01330 [Infirmifilum lucidum]